MRSVLSLTAVATVFLAGCCEHKCCLNKCRQTPPPASGPMLLPPGSVPTSALPSPPGMIPPGAIPPAGAATIPGVGPSYYPPPVVPVVPSVPGSSYKPEVLFPDPLPGTSRNSSAGVPNAAVLQAPTKPTAEPPVAKVTTSGLPGFTKVKDGLASGRKPDLDGIASLKQMGYRTVIYLHAPGADVSAVRDLAGNRGLAFIPIETTPEKLPAALDAFNSSLADKAIRPAYVFDDEGVRAGALWNLHFRTVEAMNDDAARVRARPLGLTDQGAEARAFALATQRYLELR